MNTKQARKNRPQPETDAHLPKYYLGIGIEPRENGLTVGCVVEGTPAERDGLRNGDVIVGINGERLGNDPHGNLNAVLDDPNPIVVRVRRGTQEHSITVTPSLRE